MPSMLYTIKSEVDIRLSSFKIATFGRSFSLVSTQQKQSQIAPSFSYNLLGRIWSAWCGAKTSLLSHLTVCLFSQTFPEHKLNHTPDK